MRFELIIPWLLVSFILIGTQKGFSQSKELQKETLKASTEELIRNWYEVLNILGDNQLYTFEEKKLFVDDALSQYVSGRDDLLENDLNSSGVEDYPAWQYLNNILVLFPAGGGASFEYEIMEVSPIKAASSGQFYYFSVYVERQLTAESNKGEKIDNVQQLVYYVRFENKGASIGYEGRIYSSFFADQYDRLVLVPDEPAPIDLPADMMSDYRDGQTYKIVTIGQQTWMAENLNYATSSGSWCYDNSSSNCSKYGRLYDWETARDVCPVGWHLPTDAEWTELTDYLGGKGVAGGKLKSQTGWNRPNTGATNSSGFSGAPGGLRYGSGRFDDVGSDGYWWSSTQYNSYFAWFRLLYYDYGGVDRVSFDKTYGFSVRCLRD